MKAASTIQKTKYCLKVSSIVMTTVLLSLFSLMYIGCSKPGDATVQKAMQAYSQKNYEDALTLFKQAEGEESHYSPELLDTFISTIYSQQEDLPNAIVYQEKALARHPDYRSYVTLGMMYHMVKNDEKAEKNYRTAISLNPNSAEAYESLAALYMGQDKAAEAIPLLTKAAEIEPKLAVVQANLAVAYAMTGNDTECEKSYAKAAELKCENLPKFRERIDEIQSGRSSAPDAKNSTNKQ